MTDEQFEMQLEKLKVRREFFAKHFPEIPGMKRQSAEEKLDLPNTCPVCGFYTLSERDAWEVCSICFWEDDGQDEKGTRKFDDPDQVLGGPNALFSLTSYRRLFYEYLDKIHRGKERTNIRKLLKIFEDLKANYSGDNQQDIIKLIHKMEKEFSHFHQVIIRKR